MANQRYEVPMGDIARVYPGAPANPPVPISLPPRYSPIGRLGYGQYGLVISARDAENGGSTVAIKKVHGKPLNPLQPLFHFGVFNQTNEAKRILREIRIFKHFGQYDHPNLVMQASITNLQEYVTGLPLGQSLTGGHIRAILMQILRGVGFLHAGNCIHRDLKPANILLDQACGVKVADYGLARDLAAVDAQLSETPAQSIVTQSFRAPELLLGSQRYDRSIDVWSMGCIFMFMLTRQNYLMGPTLRRIMDLFGPITAAQFPHFNAHMEGQLHAASAVQGGAIQTLGAFIPQAVEDRANAMQLLQGMMQIDPRRRWSIQQCLESNYILNLDPALIAHLPVPSAVVPAELTLEFEDANPPLTADQLKAMLYEEHREYHPGLPPIQ